MLSAAVPGMSATPGVPCPTTPGAALPWPGPRVPETPLWARQPRTENHFHYHTTGNGAVYFNAATWHDHRQYQRSRSPPLREHRAVDPASVGSHTAAASSTETVTVTTSASKVRPTSA